MTERFAGWQLDGVLAAPDLQWLATAREKTAYFTQTTGLAADALPRLRFGSGASTVVRAFPDRLPIGVCAFHHAPRASSQWRSHDAQIGYVSAKKQWIFGYRLQSLVTLRGVIIDFMLAPAG